MGLENPETRAVLAALGRLAANNPGYAHRINKFVYTLTKDEPCPDPGCIFCTSRDAEDFANRIEGMAIAVTAAIPPLAQLDRDAKTVAGEVAKCSAELHDENPGLKTLITDELLDNIGTYFFTSGMLFERGADYEGHDKSEASPLRPLNNPQTG